MLVVTVAASDPPDSPKPAADVPLPPGAMLLRPIPMSEGAARLLS